MPTTILPHLLGTKVLDQDIFFDSMPRVFTEVGKERFSNILETNLKKGKENETTLNEATPNETILEYTVKRGDTLWKIGMHLFQEDPYKIAKDNSIANPNLIYPGQKLKIHKSQNKDPQEVIASWYGKEYHHKPTASGERFDMYQPTLAHKTLPLGTIIKLFNPDNGRAAVGRINDRGPFIKGRDIDLSYGLAEQLGFVEKGIGKLIMKIL